MINENMINYKILNPSGNITALVIDDYKVEDYQKIANLIMEKNSKIEQVGFLKKIDDKINKIEYKLDMSGLEFCGNATRAFGCYLYKEKYIKEKEFNILVSGFNKPIKTKVEIINDEYYSSIELEFNSKYEDLIENEMLNGENINIIKLPGITHIMLDQDKFTFNENNCLTEAKEIINQLKLLDKEAVGVIWYKNNKINPIVWVKNINSLFYENACGSGSLAFGILYTYLNKGNEKINVIQKNNESIEIGIYCDNNFIKYATIAGYTKFSI